MSLKVQRNDLVQHVTHHVRETVRLTPGRPAIMLGIRTALATAVPLAVVPLFHPTATTWVSTAGFIIAIADKGGSYRTRFATMGGITLASMVAVFIGALAGNQLWSAPLAMFVCAAACTLVGVMSPVAAAGGVTTAVLFCISLGLPDSTVDMAIERSVAVLAGGAWAMTLALLFWPIRVYRPARFAVARCYRAVAAHARLVHAPAHTWGTESWLASVSRGHGPIRQSIEEARAVLAATRRGRRGESGRGALLLVLLQTIDLLFGAVVALEDVLDISSRDPSSADARVAIDAALKRVEECLEELASRVENEKRLEAPRIDWTLIGSELLGDSVIATGAHLHRAHVAAIMMRLRDGIANAYDTTDRLYESRSSSTVQAPVALGTETSPQSLPRRLIEELRTHPLTVRHTARVAIIATTAVLIGDALHLTRAYWVTLNVIILLQPYTAATATKTLQRVLGTAAGGIVAALMMAVLQNEWSLLVVSTVLAGVSASVLQLNYGLYSFFLTPTFVLLAEVHARDVHLPELRIINTVIGGALALLGARLFWPQRESDLLPDAIADALAALRNYFDAVMRAVIEKVPVGAAQLAELRRDWGLKVNLAEASFQRRLAETGPADTSMEPVMTLLLYGRRFGATCGAIAAARVVEANVPANELAQLQRRVDDVLASLESAARHNRKPDPLPSFEPLSNASPAMVLRLSRLPRQLAILYEAMVRWDR